MTEQTSVDLLLQDLASPEWLTGARMRELIRDLENLKIEVSRKLKEPRYITAIDQAIDFLNLQLESTQSPQILENSLKQYSDPESLKNRWRTKTTSEQLRISVWNDLKSITVVSYRLRKESLIKQYAKPLLEELIIYIQSVSKNPQEIFQACLQSFEEACNLRIQSLKSSNIVEDRDLIKFYNFLQETLGHLD